MNKFIEKGMSFLFKYKNSLVYIDSILIRNKLTHKLLSLKKDLVLI